MSKVIKAFLVIRLDFEKFLIQEREHLTFSFSLLIVFIGLKKMNYKEWKREYLELLTEVIKNHKYSEYYNNEFIEELANELLMRGYFDEDYGHWQVTPAEQAIKESFEL
ncbi:hypothetical protein [Gilliamella sp. A7]|uniref:hypothetical protein n=1 Tax=Gilliamella sp. A7 TaxID=1970465 RepID=UPI000A3502BE|nr:hypothetical protein [Gilliamella sp. A7]OTQ56178.1 hypothetical protein B6D18_11745 [Gilliamella sp. A7]